MNSTSEPYFAIGSIISNIHTTDQRTIANVDTLSPQAVADSDLTTIVYVLSDGTRWNETQLKKHWSGSCTPRPITPSKNYRDLQAGDALQEGDEYWNPRYSEWSPYDGRTGLIIGCVYAPFKYRRPISSAQ